MATISLRSDGTYAIEHFGPIPFLVVTRAGLQQLLDAMCDAGLIEQNGVKVTRQRSG